MSSILTAAGEQGTICYADNLFVLGRSEVEVAARIHRIRESVASAEVGRLGLRVSAGDRYRLGSSFEFLKQTGVVSDAGVTWQPGFQKIEQYMMSTHDHATIAMIEAAERRIKHWRRAYPDWEEGDACEAEFLAGLAVRRYYLDRNRVNFADASRAVQIACFCARPGTTILDLVPTEGSPNEHARQHLIDDVVRACERIAARAAA